MKRHLPWFIWFSIFAYAFLYMDSIRQINKSIKLFSKSPPINKVIGLKFWGNTFKIWFLIIMLPVGIIALLDFEPIITIAFYICGVYAAYDHWKWRQVYLDQLDWRK